MRRSLDPRLPAPATVARVAVAALVALLAACGRGPQTTVYDLARDAPLARWVGPDESIITAAPVTEIDYREPRVVGAEEGEEGEEAQAVPSAIAVRLFVVLDRPAPRAAILRLEAGPSAAAVAVILNRTPLGSLPLREGRHSYRLSLPAEAQHAGVNRLRLTFEPAPGVSIPTGQPFQGAFVAAADDPAIESLVASDRAPFARTEPEGGAVTLEQWAPGALRYAVRVPARASLRIGVRSLDGGAGGRFRVAAQPEGGEERTLLEGVAGPGGREQSVSLPGRTGDFVRVTLRAEPRADGLAAVGWTAPRITGAELPPDEPVGLEEATALRSRLEGMGVVLIILDAARAQEFTTWGYERATALEIDRLAREGVVFEQAYTPATYTISAMSSLWTSLYHEQHHYGANFRGPMPNGHVTLAEVLEGNGVKAVGFLANPSAGRSFGLDRGFSEFHLLRGREGRSAPRAGEMVDALPPWIEKMKTAGPSFTYVHFLEPHFPYHQPEPFVTLFGPDSPLTREERLSTHWITNVNRQRRPFTSAEHEHLVRLYDGNLAYVDSEVGRLRRMLEDAGLLDRVVLILTADHGDELYERGQIGHGGRVYDETLHIPLLVRFPAGKGPAGLRVKEPVDLLDVAPTILDAMGLAGAKGSEEFEGRSLLPVIYGGEGKPFLVGRTMHERPSYSYREGPWKLVHSVRSGQVELYRIDLDPGERTDLADREPIRAEGYRQALYRFLRGLVKHRGTGTSPLLSPEDEETLRALGYLN